MNSIRAKITWSFIILIGCSVLGTGIFVALLLKSSHLDSLSGRLIKEGEMLARTVEWEKHLKYPSYFQREAEVYGQTLDARVTIFDRNGETLGDSFRDHHILNGKEYPEVKRALTGEQENLTEIREDFVHAAFPVIRKGEIEGVIRLSLQVQNVNQSLSQVWLSLIGGLIIAFSLAAFASSRIALSVTRPLEEIIQVAVDIAQKNIHRRVQQSGKDEVARLGQAINRMAHSLQKQMEAIRKSERRLNSVIETMESGLIMVDSTGKVSVANRAFERMFSLGEGDIIGGSYQRLTYPYDLSSLIQECAESHTRLQREIHLFYPVEKVLEVNLTPMWVEKNGVGVVAVFHDLTAIRRLEQLRKDFVANVSHELKTPITSIRGFSETLLDGALNDPDTCREFLKIIHEESLRLQRLIGDILDLSGIESKQLQVKKELISINSLVSFVVKTLEDQIKSKQLTLQVDIPESFTIEADPDRFRQIFLNLLTNAMTYTPAGGSICLSIKNEKDFWTLQVSDTGIGIPEADLPRIFERFYRVDKARSRNSGGTGLGLAIVKHLVEGHQGTIDVESRIGKGTTFTLRFPHEPTFIDETNK
ncbi:two-component system histidine kinase PnpS [Hazenella coriacea]|uniref:histidine kinase n=1 Tax=Hazenella coriacea TaxID=1179467 RepID=A0A4R3LBX5_9BACL|nr:ATP-binding protein [Hazenella coriacea]TCS96740.1 two-component system phosphate regulon sensor histidine kinase PhoR [Hazenella coriacea]